MAKDLIDENAMPSCEREMATAEESWQSLFDRAKGQETQHDWYGAVETYGKVLESVPKSEHARAGDILERKAYGLHRLAFQSDSYDQFRERTSAAIECCRTAKESYEKAATPESVSRAQRCEAMAKYFMYWHSSRAEEKKALASEAWDLTKEALESFRASGDVSEFRRTYNLLSLSAQPVIWYEEEHDLSKATLVEAMALGEQVLHSELDLAEPTERALAYCRASMFLDWYAEFYVDPAEEVKLDRAARDLWEKARAISEDLACYEVANNSIVVGLPLPSDLDEPRRMREFALAFGRKIKDRLLIGHSLDGLADQLYFTLPEVNDSEELETVAAEALSLRYQAQKEFAIVGWLPPDTVWGWAPFPDPWHYGYLSFFVADTKRKRELAEKALERAEELTVRVRESGFHGIICDADLIKAVAVTSLARTNLDPVKKAALLEEAIRKAKSSQERWEKLYPLHYASQAFSVNLVADMEYEFALLEHEPRQREQKLRNALSSSAKAISLTEKVYVLPWFQQPKFLVWGGVYESIRGACALNLYELTKDKKDLEEAVRAFESAADYYGKSSQPSRCAESLWYAARAYDALEEHQKSQERFAQAADQYRAAVDKLPWLTGLYQDHARYMDAWGEVEQAKHHHLAQEYGPSGEHFGKAAELFASTQRWQYLAANYSAWSSVEKAEALSNSGKNKEAISAFGEAQDQFEESRKNVQSHLAKIQDVEEADMARRLVKVAGFRKDICRARKAIEEARILEKQGQDAASSKKYKQAVDILEKDMPKLETDRDRTEIGLIVALAKAWQMMNDAEAEDSPELFGRAAELFEQAKDLSHGERAKALALGHSRFCKALEAGMKFSDTCEASFHTEATRHLGSAAKHYLKADHRAASEYANASRLLFDSYVYMDKAGREDDQEKKAKLYLLAEKVLEASAESYEKAEYPGKKEQVLKLLEKVRRDRQLALSLTEALRAPDIVSTAIGFVAPTPTYEKATGLERFEHADVQASVIARPTDLQVGQDLNIVIELVNAGRGTAQLTKVEEVIPRGFEIVSEPEKYRVEDSYLNMKGRRLDALKTEDVKLALKPTVRGEFKLRPRIMYLDESGKYKSCEPESVTINVKELGITGWLKGPERKGG
jgi:hypothetical protein